MTDINKLLDRERFDKWLRSHKPAATVGESGRASACPLARFIVANGITDPVVFPGGVEIDGRVTRTPGWCGDFVTLVDELRDSKGRIRDHVKIRAYQAWKILEAIP